jgi:hypothetical protein
LLNFFSELKDTESAHTEARAELERMRETMEKMEQERAEMVAEVEAQIERALASMAVDIESDYDDGSSRPNSRLSSRPGSRVSSRSRRTSDAAKRPLRSFGTESTLAESYEAADLDIERVKLERETGTIPEGEEEETPASPNRKKRFSASETDMPQDGMNAVDEGISQKSDRIAQKVLEIQQKVCRFSSRLTALSQRYTAGECADGGPAHDSQEARCAGQRGRHVRGDLYAHAPDTAGQVG